MATLFRPFSPPPAAKASQFNFSDSSNSPFSFPKTHHPSSRKSFSKIQSSKFGNFLDLKPESKPEFFDFDLPKFDPSSRSRLDVIIIGTGPAGLRLAEQVSSYGIKEGCLLIKDVCFYYKLREGHIKSMAINSWYKPRALRIGAVCCPWLHSFVYNGSGRCSNRSCTTSNNHVNHKEWLRRS